jgi:hypothetical protein
MKVDKNLTTSILDFEKQPFAFLEGGLGLNDTEQYLAEGLFKRGYEIYILEELYDKPRKLAALQFLDVKTIIMGTTGVYEKQLNLLVDFFFSLDIDKLENIVLTLDTERVMREPMEKIKELNPRVKFYKISSPLWDKDWDNCDLYEIK